MMILRTLRFLILLPLALAACGDLPAPFMGNPGATARRLAQPLSPLLAVPPPEEALLTDAPSHALAAELATALQQADVPALAREAHTTDWRLVTRAEQRNGKVVPVFTVIDPDGNTQGTAEGAEVASQAWSAANPDTLRLTAEDAGPKVAALLTSIRVARDKADPNSLYNRAAKVMVADVTGAPGDGNVALTRQMRARLAEQGPVVQTTQRDADFIVQGEVKVVPIPNRQQRVEIQWVVTVADGDERGRVIQLNEIPAGTLDRFWGDVAVVVASEAAAGVNDVLVRQTGRDSRADGQAARPDAARGASGSAVR